MELDSCFWASLWDPIEIGPEPEPKLTESALAALPVGSAVYTLEEMAARLGLASSPTEAEARLGQALAMLREAERAGLVQSIAGCSGLWGAP